MTEHVHLLLEPGPAAGYCASERPQARVAAHVHIARGHSGELFQAPIILALVRLDARVHSAVVP